jgi:hypothetical protein
MDWRLGSEVWGVVFDDRACRYNPRRTGRVIAVKPGAIEVTRARRPPEWIGTNTYPLFASEDAARAWCDTHLPLAPTVPSRVELAP